MNKIREIKHSIGYGVYWKFSIIERHVSIYEIYFKRRQVYLDYLRNN